MNSHASLDAAAQERKARLAKLKSLKRKQPDSSQDAGADRDTANAEAQPAKSPSPDVTSTYLSGRNYDIATRGPKLGFENAPSAGQETLEERSAAIAAQTKAEAEKEEKGNAPLDLFKLQPKKPNWDLKRDLNKKLEVLNVRTDNAIARMVRERVEAAQNAAREKKTDGASGEEEEAPGMAGIDLVEAMHVREREEEEDERRERELEREFNLENS
ncbi:hypothetical protein M501DRAFT_930495 [Patellaria atrata CBS 101060]|uniref:Cwf18 pre-mRNA splicing factor n=1 Tax=Patellaria atrata CBS 101060 TaxID=1346257 RepID=A0A9P4VR49_9PEZI|nr:hypothetical protein M501DRAFT_930495 [Patellaria atrata CBS 101060]